MTAHDYLCRAAELGIEDTERCDCQIIERARADERERIATAWQLGGWTVITTKVNARSVLGAAQAVTDWIRGGGRDD